MSFFHFKFSCKITTFFPFRKIYFPHVNILLYLCNSKIAVYEQDVQYILR